MHVIKSTHAQKHPYTDKTGTHGKHFHCKLSYNPTSDLGVVENSKDDAVAGRANSQISFRNKRECTRRQENNKQIQARRQPEMPVLDRGDSKRAVLTA